jgi:hypothetical protein
LLHTPSINVYGKSTFIKKEYWCNADILVIVIFHPRFTSKFILLCNFFWVINIYKDQISRQNILYLVSSTYANILK